MNNFTFILSHLLPNTLSIAWSVKYTTPVNQHCVWNSYRKYIYMIYIYDIHYMYDVYCIYACVWVNRRIYQRNIYCTMCWAKDIKTPYISDVFIYRKCQNIFKYQLTFRMLKFELFEKNKTITILIEHLCFVFSDKVHTIKQHAACNETNDKTYAPTVS